MKYLLLSVSLFVCHLTAIVSSDDPIPILRELNNVNPDGSYNYAYETGNGIGVEEQGFLKDDDTQVAQGQYQYEAPDGQVFKVVYVADENGFQPQGEHFPTPPPIPEPIKRALEWIKAHPEENDLKRRRR